MKLIDTETGCVIANITTNRSMSIDEALDLMGCTVSEDGIIMDGDTELNAGYDTLEMIF